MAATTAATFVNQKSKISTLRSQMLAICREIDESLLLVSATAAAAAPATTTTVADGTISTTARLQDISLAYDFLEMQESRVDRVEQELLKATNDILPSSSSSSFHQQQQDHEYAAAAAAAPEERMTMSEVAQVLQDLTAMYDKQHERLEHAALAFLNETRTNSSTRTTIETAAGTARETHAATTTTTLTANDNGAATTGAATMLFNNLNIHDYDNDSPTSSSMDASISASLAAGNTPPGNTTSPVIAGLPPLYWCIGPTLSAVTETDHETDGTTTVGSATPASSIFVSPAMMMMTQNNNHTSSTSKAMMMSSSASGNSSSRRRRLGGGRRLEHGLSPASYTNDGTPTTPTVPLLSAWTTSVLEQETEEEHVYQQQHHHSTTMTPTNINNSLGGDEDDEGTKVLTATASSRHGGVKEPSSGKKRHDHFLRLELQLHRDIHKATTGDSLHRQHDQGENRHQDAYYDSGHVNHAPPTTRELADYAADHDEGDDESDDDDETDEYDFDESLDTENYTIATDTSTIVAADRMFQCFAPKPSGAATEGRRHENAMEHEEDDDDDDDDYTNNEVDDSALYCATVLAEGGRLHSTLAAGLAAPAQPRRLPPSRTFPSEIITTKNHHRHRYTNHRIDQQAAPTTDTARNLTMEDKRYLNNDMLFSLSTVLENGKKNKGRGGYELDEAASQVSEAASEETPVLDRYRLDPDEESPNGFRVVPNQRRRHRHHHHGKLDHVVVAAINRNNNLTEQKQVASVESKAPLVDERKDNHDNHGRPPAARFSVSSSPMSRHAAAATTTPRSGRRQQYSKTASLAKTNRMPSTPTIDENSPLLVVDDNPTVSSPQQTILHCTAAQRSPLSNIPDQLERTPGISSPSLAGGEGNLTNKSLLQQFNRPLPPSLLYAQTQLSSIHDDDNDESPPFSSSLRLESIRKDNNAGQTAAKNNLSTLHPITSISQAEYDSAPRVVQMQVRYDEVQAVTTALNNSLKRRRQYDNTTATPIELGEDDIKQLLKPLGLPDRKSKSILMSLCHWRRLVMRRREDGVFFAVSLE